MKMDKKQLGKLVEKVKKGDQEAFKELYLISSRSVYFTCVNFLRNEEDAKDVMQDVYITVYEKINALNDAEKLIPWMNKIAVNKCKKLLTKRKAVFTDLENASDEPTEEKENFLPEEYITQKEKRKLVMDIMKHTLSDIQYKTVILYYFSGMPIDEIAEIMECPPGTVKYRLSVARAKIRDGVDAYENRSGDKLYSVVGLPLLMRLLYEEANSFDMPDLLQEMIEAISSHLAAGAAESAAATTESGAAAEEAARNTIGIKRGIMEAGKKALWVKIGIAAAVAAVIAVGVVFFIKYSGKEETPDRVTENDVQDQPSVSGDAAGQPSDATVDWYAVGENGCLPFYLKYAGLGALEEKDFSGLMINDTFQYGAGLEEILSSYHYFEVSGMEGSFTTGLTEYLDGTTLDIYGKMEIWCYSEEGNYDDDIRVAIYNLSDSEAPVRDCIENDWFICYAGYCMLGTEYELEDDKREELAQLAEFLGKPSMVTYEGNSSRDLREAENETFDETVSIGGGRIDYNLVYIKGDHILSIHIAEDITPEGIIIWVDPLYLTQDVYERFLENDIFSYEAAYIMTEKIYEFE